MGRQCFHVPPGQPNEIILDSTLSSVSPPDVTHLSGRAVVILRYCTLYFEMKKAKNVETSSRVRPAIWVLQKCVAHMGESQWEI
jgi:hypothetical protein